MQVMAFEDMWSELAPVGRVSSGGYQRLAFTAAEEEAHSWFLDQCRRRDLTVEEDRFGNAVAWWDLPSADSSRQVDGSHGVPPLSSVHNPALQRRRGGGGGGGVVTGSHLDSVADGGAYDGPLGVVSALAAVDRLRERGVHPARSLGVAVFVEEEGSRFGLACLGSRLATGSLPWARAAALTDRDGVSLEGAGSGGQLG